MKRIPRAGELAWVFGMVLVALGVSICSKADLGVSMIAAPAFLLSSALAPNAPFFSVGVTEYLIQGVLLALLCLLIRRFRPRFLLAFLVAVLYGYLLDLFLLLLGTAPIEALWLRYLLLLVGDAITALGVACFFRTYLPLQVYELFVAETARRFGFAIPKVKWAFDLSLLALSLLLAFTLFGDAATFSLARIGSESFHYIGVGTVLTTLINSPLIAAAGKLLDRLFDPSPRFPQLHAALTE